MRWEIPKALAHPREPVACSTAKAPAVPAVPGWLVRALKRMLYTLPRVWAGVADLVALVVPVRAVLAALVACLPIPTPYFSRRLPTSTCYVEQTS